MTADPEIIPR